MAEQAEPPANLNTHMLPGPTTPPRVGQISEFEVASTRDMLALRREQLSQYGGLTPARFELQQQVNLLEERLDQQEQRTRIFHNNVNFNFDKLLDNMNNKHAMLHKQK